MTDDLLEFLKDDLAEQLIDAADSLYRGVGWSGMEDLMREAAAEIRRLEGRLGDAEKRLFDEGKLPEDA